MPKTVLSRLTVWLAMLCMVAMVNAVLASVQADILNLQHATSGDLQLPDGGWVKTCNGGADDCDSHAAPLAEHEDGTPFGHHHHHGGEAPAGQPATAPAAANTLRLTSLDLRPATSVQPAGIIAATPDQPPRA